MTQNNYPVRNQTYTLEEITKLTLKDQPFLRIWHEGKLEVINMTKDLEEICENALLAETRWTYIRTTHEWCPLFTFASDNEWPLEVIVTIERSKWYNPWGERSRDHWVRFIGDHAEELTEEQQQTANFRRDNPLQKPVKAEPEPVVEAPVAVMNVVPVVKARVTFPVPEMLHDPMKAKAYVEDRMDDAKQFLASLTWDCSADEGHDSAKLYCAGQVVRYKRTNALSSVYWGMVELSPVLGQARPSVYFKTEDCFVAWVLAKFW